MGRLYQFW